ncbi:inter-alpha-trypsin inhibitor heavy chain, partial [Striga asiatica]
MAADFSKAVELGLQLTNRIYYGKDAGVPAPAPPRTVSMTAEPDCHLPTAPMVYAEITDPASVDNPDIPSYQPYVHGRCEPPAMIPLHMHGVSVEVDCCLDTAFVTVSGAWRVHCVSASRSCCCRIAVPMGEEVSVLGVEVESPFKSYSTQLISLEDTADAANVASSKDGFLIRGCIYTLKIPQVDGGTMLSIKVSWSQKMLYENGEFCLNMPFTFPSHVIPMVKNLSKKEKIVVNVNSVAGTEVLFQCTSHPLKNIGQEGTKVGFSCEREVSVWSMADFRFSYNVSSSEINGGLLLQSPSLHDFDQSEMFCFYLYPGKSISKKYGATLQAFRKEVVFLVDISASMQGSPIEHVKSALLAALSKLDPADTFNIIAFNGNSLLFSPSLVQATTKMIEKASEWTKMSFVAEGGTNISTPLNQAINMFSKTGGLLPIIFLITDGAVEDEKDICDAMRGHLMKGGLTTPRICTFGIGSYCNHYFLQMLAQIGRGHYDAAPDIGWSQTFGIILYGSINSRLERLISNASSVILADLSIDALKHLDSLEIYPSLIPDLLSGCPLFISGRYSGKFPDSIDIGGTLPDLSNFEINVKVRNAKDIQIDRVFAKRQIDALTANAWFSGSKQLEEKAMKLSLLMGVPSEYTSMILVETNKGKLPSKSKTMPEEKAEATGQKIIYLRGLGLGFGSIEATVENRPPEHAEPKLYETSEKILKAATDCCSRMVDCCCCMCFIQFCGKLNDQCAVACTQLCSALACFGCIEMCCEKTISDAGFSLINKVELQLDENMGKSVYIEHSYRMFFSRFVRYMSRYSSGFCRLIVSMVTAPMPELVMVLEKENGIADLRALIGPTDVSKANKVTHPRSVRALRGADICFCKAIILVTLVPCLVYMHLEVYVENSMQRRLKNVEEIAGCRVSSMEEKGIKELRQLMLLTEPPKDEFSDWPHGLLTIGTFGNTTELRNKQENRVNQNCSEIENVPQEELQCSSPDFSEFTAEEVGKLEKELKRLLNKKQSSKSAEDQINADLPLDRFLNCPSSLDNRTISNRFSTYSDGKDEEEIERTIRIILGRCKDVCEKKKNKTIGKKSLTFLLMRTLLTKKIYSQNSYRASSSKKYLGDYRPASKPEEKEEESRDKSRAAGSKWDKTDSE